MFGRLGILIIALQAQSATPWTFWSAKDARDPRAKRLLRELEASRARALAHIEKSFGLTVGERPVEWILRTPSPDGTGSAFHVGETVIREERVTVALPPHRYFGRPDHARGVIVHEAAHALLGSRLGPTAYRHLAPWFREGFALHASGEGEGRVAARIATTLVEGKQPASFLRGLATRPLPAESYLAVAWLVDKLGENGFRVLVRKLAAGGDLEAELTRALASNADELGRSMRQFARSRVEKACPEVVVDRFGRAMSAYRTKSLEEARRAFAALGESSKARVVHATSRYFLARVTLLAGDPEGARTQLESLLDARHEVLWEPEILEQIGNCHVALNRPREADRYFDEVLERFPDDRAVCARIRKKRTSDR